MALITLAISLTAASEQQVTPSSPLRPAGQDKIFFDLALGDILHSPLRSPSQTASSLARRRRVSPHLPSIHPSHAQCKAPVLLASHSEAGSLHAAACLPSTAVPKNLSIKGQDRARPRLRLVEVDCCWAIMLRSWKFNGSVYLKLALGICNLTKFDVGWGDVKKENNE